MACLWHTQEHGVPIQLERTKKQSNNVNKRESNTANREQPARRQRGGHAGNTLLVPAGVNNQSTSVVLLP